MFKIGEFSQLGQVSVRMLRHYDKLGLLNPEHTDPFTGYRYYKLDQLPRLNRILALKDLGLSLDEIARLLESNLELEQLEGMLLMKQAQIQQNIQEEQQRLARVASRLRQIKQEDEPSPYEIVLKTIDPVYIVGKRQVVPTLDDMKAYRCGGFDVLYDWLRLFQVETSGYEMVIYHMQEFVEENIDMELALPLGADAVTELQDRCSDDVYIRDVQSPFPMATTVHYGSIMDIPSAIIALGQWVVENDYHFAGAVQELHLSGSEQRMTDYDNIVFEFQIPVSKA